MKPYQVHTIKSERIARARLGRPLPTTLPKSSREKLKVTKRQFGRQTYRTGRRIQKQDISNTTSESGKRRRPYKRCKPFKRNRRRLVQKCSETSVSTKPRAGSGNSSETPEASEPTVDDLQKIPTIKEDGQPWTQEEIKYFENVYGDKLFDNTIDTGPDFQASFQNLNVGSFKSYKKQASGVFANRTRQQLLLTLEQGRSVLDKKAPFFATDSQLVRLLSFFNSEIAFYNFLNSEIDLLSNYFTRPKTSARGGWSKRSHWKTG